MQDLYMILTFSILARIADVASTLWCTPNLLLEGNRFIQRYGKLFLYSTIFAGLIPLLDLNIGIMGTTISLLAAFHNLCKATLYRALGEESAFNLIQRHRLQIGPRKWLVYSSIPLIVPIILGLMIIYTSRNDVSEMTYYVGVGAILFSIVVFLQRCFAK